VRRAGEGWKRSGEKFSRGRSPRTPCEGNPPSTQACEPGLPGGFGEVWRISISLSLSLSQFNKQTEAPRRPAKAREGPRRPTNPLETAFGESLLRTSPALRRRPAANLPGPSAKLCEPPRPFSPALRRTSAKCAEFVIGSSLCDTRLGFPTMVLALRLLRMEWGWNGRKFLEALQLGLGHASGLTEVASFRLCLVGFRQHVPMPFLDARVSQHQCLIRKCTAYNLMLCTDRLARVSPKRITRKLAPVLHTSLPSQRQTQPE